MEKNCENCNYCELMDKVDKFVQNLFKKVKDEDKAALAGYMAVSAVLEGSDSVVEGVGILDICKTEYREACNDAMNEENQFKIGTN